MKNKTKKQEILNEILSLYHSGIKEGMILQDLRHSDDSHIRYLSNSYQRDSQRLIDNITTKLFSL